MRRLGAFIAALVVVHAAGGFAQQPQTTFRGRADSVAIDVSVRRAGRPIPGLTVTDFEVRDNNVPQTVTDLSFEKLPIDVTIALDVSASVTEDLLARLRQAVRQLTAGLTEQDRLKVIAFNMRIRQLTDFAPPSASVDAAFTGVAGTGSSSIFDTLAVALTAPLPGDRRQLIVLFSDGEDSSSVTDPETLLDVARHTTPTVHVVLAPTVPQTIALVRQPVTARETAYRRVFTSLAAETGGSLVPFAAGDNLAATFRRALDEFRSSYVLHFVPTGVEHAGAHTLTVRVNKPGTYDVRTRAGYIWR